LHFLHPFSSPTKIPLNKNIIASYTFHLNRFHTNFLRKGCISKLLSRGMCKWWERNEHTGYDVEVLWEWKNKTSQEVKWNVFPRQGILLKPKREKKHKRNMLACDTTLFNIVVFFLYQNIYYNKWLILLTLRVYVCTT
jgi:hypothetical protein